MRGERPKKEGGNGTLTGLKREKERKLGGEKKKKSGVLLERVWGS